MIYLNWRHLIIASILSSFLFACEKETLNPHTSNHFEGAFVTEHYIALDSDNSLNTYNSSSAIDGNCGETAVAEQTDGSTLTPLLTEQGFQLLWNDFQDDWPQTDQASGGGGGLLHDITIWPTKALQDHGFGGTIGISFTIGAAYLAANPDMLIGSEEIEDIPLQATNGAHGGGVIITIEDGEFVPTADDTETGWSLQAIYATTDGDIGVVVIIDDFAAGAPVPGKGVLIVPNDDLGIDSEVFSSVNYGAIVIVEEEIFAQVSAYNDYFFQNVTASFNENTPYGLLPEVKFDFLTETGTPTTLSVLLNDCPDDDLLYWEL